MNNASGLKRQASIFKRRIGRQIGDSLSDLTPSFMTDTTAELKDFSWAVSVDEMGSIDEPFEAVNPYRLKRKYVTLGRVRELCLGCVAVGIVIGILLVLFIKAIFATF